MKTNRKKSAPRRDWRVTLFLIISLLIVLTMVLGSVLLALPGPS
jgi:hypothetical protein